MTRKMIAVALISIVTLNQANAQEKYFTKEGKITFYSATPIEKFDATNSTCVSVLDVTTGNIEMSALIKAFEFEKDLMEKHFNENYMESDKFPKAVFKGTLVNIASIDFKKPGTYVSSVTGKLTMHGVTKDLTANVTFIISASGIMSSSEFIVLLADYNIKVPGVVKNQISQQIKVEINNNYKPYVKQ